MTTETDTFDLDPSDEELASLDGGLQDVIQSDLDEWADDTLDLDSNLHDDRYDGDGIPSWSAWA